MNKILRIQDSYKTKKFYQILILFSIEHISKLILANKLLLVIKKLLYDHDKKIKLN